MTQHHPGDHNLKLESALGCKCQQGIASCFCLAQARSVGAYVKVFVCVFVCSDIQIQYGSTLGIFFCT